MGINYERLYDYRLGSIDQPRRQAVWNEIAGYVYRCMRSPARVLDPGAGRCEFLNSFRGVLPPSPLLTRAYLRVPALWRVLGQQFLVLAVKPS
jgi:hypothetical protein